jgi:site-specific DNA-methyltransferase (adenine-specific)
VTPYYEDDAVTIYHGDCREMPFPVAVSLVSDPPYPNNAGHFDGAVSVARDVLAAFDGPEAAVFWTELEPPPVHLPLVAVHIWHRSNVNGRPYEPVFVFAVTGQKRRSEVWRQPAIFDGAGPGCHEYLGHPTQKPVALMRLLIQRTPPLTDVLDPFMGSGTTLRAAKDLGRKAIGIEIEERYCEIAAKRMAQEVLAI